MDDQSRYEEVPQKENPFVKIFKTLGTYFKELFLNFIQSFKYNDMKLAAILAAIPGFALGFFIRFHSVVVNTMTFTIVGSGGKTYGLPFDWSGIAIFFLMLFGILNIFGAVSMSSKKNLGSVVTTTITSSGIIIFGALYLVAIFVFLGGISTGAIRVNGFSGVDINWIMSIVSVVVSMALAVAGVVLGFINYDRTYEKVDR